jgi:hypothetical protein
VHRFDSGISYLVPDDDGNDAFTAGSAISTPENLSVFGSSFGIHVSSIDTTNEIATVSLGRAPAQIPQVFPPEGPYQTPWIKWLEATSRGDAVVILDGKTVSIPRHSAAYRILENVALYESGSLLLSPQLQAAIKEEALNNVARLSQTEISRSPFGVPATSPTRKRIRGT